ncbi:hypothetical protein GCM10010994_45720 [Chelatococcus reniformis]|uniref:Uncharacterized protein n=1 Tax=Chelatococcus reniformis TaxID=1494448 RepID=A0A916XL24_9HYPH|nr:hypothetical protein GCM10010994_45720 [Chelatococcus reniformis]
MHLGDSAQAHSGWRGPDRPRGAGFKRIPLLGHPRDAETRCRDARNPAAVLGTAVLVSATSAVGEARWATGAGPPDIRATESPAAPPLRAWPIIPKGDTTCLVA